MKAPANRQFKNAAESRDGVAIIGMSCLFPGARDVDAYWRNILNKVDAVSDAPPEAWDADVYYDPDFQDSDKVYAKRGGYLGSLVSFDPLAYGIPPMSVGGEPDQWLALKLAYDAMEDAGCADLPEHIRHRTAVVLGKGTYLNGGNATAIQRTMIVGQTLGLIKQLNPDIGDDRLELLRQEMKRILPPIGPETVAGLIPNIIVGRIANRLDLMGPTYTVDAACASSLVAVQLAMRDLLNGECDLALAGGAQVWMPVAALNVFCQLGALSRDQQIRPFDKDANGTLLGEGIGMVVLKRLADAERDEDRIYAVLRGVGVASDGRGVSVMAPRIDGEEMALRRAYADAGVSPDSIGLIEAHGTATAVGDAVEIQALTRVFGERAGGLPRCALGTVKSMISHTIPASGVAGLIKTALALHQKVLPPTLHVGEPNPKLELEKTPFYLNTETRPWIHGGDEPRRAGINAFGFGGINAHAIVEEYRPAASARALDMFHMPPWDSEVVILDGDSPAGLLARSRHVEAWLADRPEASLVDVAYTLNLELRPCAGMFRLSIVAATIEDLRRKLDRAAQRLADPDCRQIKDVSGIFYFAQPVGIDGEVALLFPGEGAQYPNMLADLCLHFPEVREAFDRYDRIFIDHPRGDLPSDFIFPRPAFTEAERLHASERLTQMDVAIEAVQAANQAMFALLRNLGVPADACLGHSSGEYSAAVAAGVFDMDSDERFIALGRALYQYYADAAARRDVPKAVLLAIGAPREQVEAIAREAGDGIFLAVDNCPHQSILIGDAAAADRTRAILEREGLIYERLAYDRAVHTPLFEPYTADLRRLYEQVPIRPARIPLYSGATSQQYPADADATLDLFVEHWSRPVEFQRTIEALYADGVRVFVEAGPRGNLSAFVEDILRGRPACVVPANVMRRSGITQLNHLVGMLSAQGIDLDLAYLYKRRDPKRLDGSDTERERGPGYPMLLSSGWPMLRFSEEFAERVRPAPHDAGPTSLSSNGHAVPYAATDETIDSASATPLWHAPAAQGLERVAAEPLPLTMLGSTPPGDDVSDVLAAHLDMMDQFLLMQQDVIQAFLGSVDPARQMEGAAPHDDRRLAPEHRYPLLGTIVTWESGRELVAERVFDRERDRYLQDHTLGRAVSTTDDGLTPLAIMPLTMSLEILAEAAACLLPGCVVVGMRDVHAGRWLAWEDEPQTLRVSATRQDTSADFECVRVTLRNLSEPEGDGVAPRPPVVEATVLLSDAYPQPAPRRLSQPSQARRSRWTPDRLYRDVMFHGPAWQGVTGIEGTGADGIVARLEVLPAAEFLVDAGPLDFVIDPITLDAAGQAIGFWTTEHLSNGSVIFPFRLNGLDIFGPRPPVGAPIGCTAQIGLVGDQLVRSDIELTTADGTLWMRLEGWEDKRFDVPEHLHALILSDSDRMVSSDWSAHAVPLNDDRIACRAVDTTVRADQTFWKRVWARRVLGRAERERFAELRFPDHRQLEWLGARTAAKEAVQLLVRRHYGLELLPADIEIHAGLDGQPLVTGSWLASVGGAPIVSLAHTDGLAVALAALPADGGIRRVGIDIERLKERPDGFADVAFDEIERGLIHATAAINEREWLLRCWCAKEAAGKAVGLGLVDGPRSFAVVAIDVESGRVLVEPRGRLAARLEPPADTRIVVYTRREDEVVSAVTSGEHAGP